MKHVDKLVFGVASVGLALLLAACATSRTDAPMRKDAALIERVDTALRADPEIAQTGIHVDSYRGKVQLSGYVDTDKLAKRAVAIAGKVSGVKEVVNNMMVCGVMP